MKSLVLAFLIFCGVANAFPEMVRHRYGNCTSCHTSPNGGGILTEYGRGLSRESLSTWGAENEEKFLYNFVKLPAWLNLGGDVRAVQTWMNSNRVEAAKFIFMQGDLEAALGNEKLQVVGTVGYQSKNTFNKGGADVFSRRHYLLYRHDENVAFRAGKFMPAIGINNADHMIATKRGLGWDEGSETYNLEGSFNKDPYEVFVTGVFGRPEFKSLDRESGVAIRPGILLNETYKAGVSYYYGSNDKGKRHVAGPWAILGITPRVFVLAELDFQNSRPAAGSPAWGMVNYLRVNYEFLQGAHVYLTQELSKFDFNNPKSTIEAYGIGAQFFPRPHFEFQAAFQKQKVHATSDDFSDFAWLMLHYYL